MRILFLSRQKFIAGEKNRRRSFEKKFKLLLCPFAVYYLRYAVRSFFTMSRMSLVDGNRAGQKVQRKIAVAVQKVISPLLFVPLF